MSRPACLAGSLPFLYDMPTVLGRDLVVARSGAMTIAELTVCGKPAILIPLPTRDLQSPATECGSDGGGGLFCCRKPS